MRTKIVAAAVVALLLQAQAFAGSHYGQQITASDWIAQVLKMLQDIAANSISNIR
jgi:hypothetical protein